jgi:hypothetical protein
VCWPAWLLEHLVNYYTASKTRRTHEPDRGLGFERVRHIIKFIVCDLVEMRCEGVDRELERRCRDIEMWRSHAPRAALTGLSAGQQHSLCLRKEVLLKIGLTLKTWGLRDLL